MWLGILEWWVQLILDNRGLDGLFNIVTSHSELDLCNQKAVQISFDKKELIKFTWRLLMLGIFMQIILTQSSFYIRT